uniref:Env polyprotein n=1 Tax=Rhinella marina endogenous retrovirus TaxID=2218595 RepID=A0A2U9K4X2_9RETR|nr:envelope protein [Rhinella marina endogenous retrovirus]
MSFLIFLVLGVYTTEVASRNSAIFWVNMSAPVVTYKFDFCDVARCTGAIETQFDYESIIQGEFYICVTHPGDEWCSYWSDAGWNTGKDWGYKPQEGRDRKDKNGVSLLTRMTLTRGKAITGRCQPRRDCFPLCLNIVNPSPGDLGKYVLGSWDRSITPFLGQFVLKDINTRPTKLPPPIKRVTPGGKLQAVVDEVIPIPGLRWEEVFSIETQTAPRKNLWLEWVRYNVRVQNISVGCIACAAANTHLYTHALALPDDNITTCMMSLLKGFNSSDCLDYVPLVHERPRVRVPGEVTVLADNYTCYSSDDRSGTPVGVFEPGFCKGNSTVNADLLVDHIRYMYDIYWLCGDGKLRSRLPTAWMGQCTLIKLAMQFRILPWDLETPDEPTRKKRSFDQLHMGYEEDPQVYIDAIGVPRGVPDQFKAQNQVYAGLASLIPQVQINKNVDWINYVYYSEQRFINYSHDAFQGIVEELGPNTRMTLQNRLALDMILAEKGGVCGMVGEECCTYIPQNSGVKGKTMIALRKIIGLAAELKTNAGVDTSFFSSWLGGFKGFLQQACLVLIGLIVVGLMILCCVIPLYKKAIAKATPTGTFLNQEADLLEGIYTDLREIPKYVPLKKLNDAPYSQMKLRDLV